MAEEERASIMSAFKGASKPDPYDKHYDFGSVFKRGLIAGAADKVVQEGFRTISPIVKAVTDPIKDVVAGPLSTTFKSKQTAFLERQGPQQLQKNYNQIIDYKTSIEKRLEEARNAGITHRQQIENEAIVPMGNEIRKSFDRSMLKNNAMYDSTKYDEKLFQNIARVRMNQPIEASDETIASYIKSPAIIDAKGKVPTRKGEKVFPAPRDQESIIDQIYNAEKNFLTLARNIDDKTTPLALQSLAAIAMPSDIVQSLRKGDVRRLNTLTKSDNKTFTDVAELFMAATYQDAQKELETGIDTDVLRQKVDAKTGKLLFDKDKKPIMVSGRSYQFKSRKLNALYNTFVDLNKAGMAVTQLTSIDQFEMFKDAYTEEQILKDAESLGQQVNFITTHSIDITASGNEVLTEKKEVKITGVLGESTDSIKKEVVMDLSEGDNQFIYAKNLQKNSLSNLLIIQGKVLSPTGMRMFDKMLHERMRANPGKYKGRDNAPINIASTTMSLPQYNELLSLISVVANMQDGVYSKDKNKRTSAIFETITQEWLTTNNRLRTVRQAVRKKPREKRTENFEFILDNSLLLDKNERFDIKKFVSPTDKSLLRNIPKEIYQHPANPNNQFEKEDIDEHIKALAQEEFTRRESIEEVKHLKEEIDAIHAELNTLDVKDVSRTIKGTTVDDETGFKFPVVEQKETLTQSLSTVDPVVSTGKKEVVSSLLGKDINIDTKNTLEKMKKIREGIFKGTR